MLPIAAAPPPPPPLPPRASSQQGGASPNWDEVHVDASDAKELAKAYTAIAVEALARVLVDPATPASARISAANALLERGHGKMGTPPVHVDVPELKVEVEIV